MLVMIVCGLLFVGGLVIAILWSGLPIAPPEQWQGPGRPPVAEVLRRYVWWLAVGTLAGMGAGVLVAGAGGRLIMRLLAATSPESRGKLTEANEVVGDISVGGTIGFIVFTGLFAGLLSSLLYLLIRRWLPAGRLGGLTFGVLLLLLFGSRVDPVRADNIDFILVGPSWLAVLTFCALALVHGLVVVGIAGRYSRSLPLLDRRTWTLLGYSPLLFLLLVPPLALLAVLGGLVAVAVSRFPAVPAAWAPRSQVAGRVLIALIALVALPGFVMAVGDLLSAT